MLFRFLSALTEVVCDENGKLRALRVENTELVKRGESLSAKGTGEFYDIECDTLVFAIGDRVDETLGLPCTGVEYVKNPNPDPDNPGDEAYQVYDPETEKSAPMFVIGWSRQASDGVVGRAKQDGERDGRGQSLPGKDRARLGRKPEREDRRAARVPAISRRASVDYSDVRKPKPPKTGVAKPRSRILQIFHRRGDARGD